MVRLPATPTTNNGIYFVRIQLTAARRRHLDRMAREAGQSADDLASEMLSHVLDDDAAAHKAVKK